MLDLVHWTDLLCTGCALCMLACVEDWTKSAGSLDWIEEILLSMVKKRKKVWWAYMWITLVTVWPVKIILQDPRPSLIPPFVKQYATREWNLLTENDEFTFVLKNVGNIATKVGESPDDISFRVGTKNGGIFPTRWVHCGHTYWSIFGAGWVCLEEHDLQTDAEFGLTATTRSQFSCAKHALAYHSVVPQSPIALPASTTKKQRKQQVKIFGNIPPPTPDAFRQPIYVDCVSGGSSAFIQLKTPEAQEAHVLKQLKRSKEKQAIEKAKAPYVPSVTEEPDENNRNARFRRCFSAYIPGISPRFSAMLCLSVDFHVLLSILMQCFYLSRYLLTSSPSLFSRSCTRAPRRRTGRWSWCCNRTITANSIVMRRHSTRCTRAIPSEHPH